jgi:predicted naringenin-chalcone synthase
MGPKILAVAKALPPFSRSTEEVLPRVEAWLTSRGMAERDRRKVLRIFQYAQVDRRYSIMDMDEVFTETSFEAKNQHFIEQSTLLGQQALESALAQAALTPQDIDFIITVSCTGFMIPSMDATIINRLEMRQDIVRLPVTEMGCAAGTSALIYAHEFLKANPNKRAAVIAVESPTSTFQHQDLRMTNMVSAAIFGDGAACAILGPSEEVRPRILDTHMYHYYDALHFMGYTVRSTGFEMVLDISVPEEIEKHFPDILHPFLAKNGLTVDQIDHFIFHPGGKKIVQMVEGLLHGLGKDIDDSKAVLREYGNMSSATVLYVLERCMAKQPAAGERGLMLAFGPGFSAQRLLLEWE